VHGGFHKKRINLLAIAILIVILNQEPLQLSAIMGRVAGAASAGGPFPGLTDDLQSFFKWVQSGPRAYLTPLQVAILVGA
jgi:hypothetical protein